MSSSNAASSEASSTSSFEERPAIYPRAVRIAASVAALLSVFIAVWIIFGIGSWLRLYVPLENEYLFALLGLLVPIVFLARDVRGATRQGSVPAFDYALALLAFAIAMTFAFKSDSILFEGWVYLAPNYAKVLSIMMWVLVLEGLRRSSGLVIFIICALFSLYPVFSDLAPGILRAQATAFDITAGFYIFSSEGILGVPFGAFATLVIGFLIFGVALQYTGGGAFFLNLAFALLGTRRGGPAKVAIFSSGLMGSMSGSVITNVLTTGVMSIPAMKQVGFSPATQAAWRRALPPEAFSCRQSWAQRPLSWPPLSRFPIPRSSSPPPSRRCSTISRCSCRSTDMPPEMRSGAFPAPSCPVSVKCSVRDGTSSPSSSF